MAILLLDGGIHGVNDAVTKRAMIHKRLRDER